MEPLICKLHQLLHLDLWVNTHGCPDSRQTHVYTHTQTYTHTYGSTSLTSWCTMVYSAHTRFDQLNLRPSGPQGEHTRVPNSRHHLDQDNHQQPSASASTNIRMIISINKHQHHDFHPNCFAGSSSCSSTSGQRRFDPRQGSTFLLTKHKVAKKLFSHFLHFFATFTKHKFVSLWILFPL